MKSFLLPDKLTGSLFFRSREQNTSLRRLRTIRQKQVLLDTFDGRLARRGLLLLKTGAEYALVAHKSRCKESRHRCHTRRTIRFAAELADPLRKKLAPIVESRALLPIARCLKIITEFVVQRNEQVLGHGRLIELHGDQQRLLYVAVESERGSPGRRGSWISRLAKIGLTECDRSPYAVLLERMKVNPAGYAPKRVLRLQPAWPVQRALQTILKYQILVMVQNERGLRQDWDAEFLHDFRVAIRRTRSILSQFKKAFPADLLQQRRKDFANLSERTNRLRDLDVQLQRRAQYTARLPASLHPGLEKLYKAISRERQKEFSVLLKTLNSHAWQRSKKEWRCFLQTQTPASWSTVPAAGIPIKRLVCKLVMKKFKQMQKMEQKDWGGAQDEALHRLRIEAKKLRYLLEFFASLFPPQSLNTVLEQLRQVQDYLGHLNDLAVQQEQLLDHLQKQSALLRHPQTTAAIGALVAVLHQEQTRLRENPDVLRPFFTPDHKKMYKRLFQI
jgi:CHAD domain-containing protein